MWRNILSAIYFRCTRIFRYICITRFISGNRGTNMSGDAIKPGLKDLTVIQASEFQKVANRKFQMIGYMETEKDPGFKFINTGVWSGSGIIRLGKGSKFKITEITEAEEI